MGLEGTLNHKKKKNYFEKMWNKVEGITLVDSKSYRKVIIIVTVWISDKDRQIESTNKSMHPQPFEF